MSAFTTIRIRRSTAMRAYIKDRGVGIRDLDQLLEQFLDRRLEEALFNATIVDDDVEDHDDSILGYSGL